MSRIDAPSGLEDAGPPRKRIRRGAVVAQQRTVLIYLILGGLIFFGFALGAAVLTVGRSGLFAQRAALAVVQRYMELGRDSETLPAHRLFSEAALARTTEADVAETFAQRRYFDGFERVALRSAQPIDAAGLAEEAMRIEAIATYTFSPPALVTATLEQADGHWRLTGISFGEPPASGGGQEPPP